MNVYIKILRDNLLYIAGKDELTNAEMAKKCGISKTKLEDILYMRERGMRFDTIERISCSLQIPISELIGCGEVLNSNDKKGGAEK